MRQVIEGLGRIQLHNKKRNRYGKKRGRMMDQGGTPAQPPGQGGQTTPVTA